MPFPWKPVAIGAGVLGVLLIARRSPAAPNAPDGGGGGGVRPPPPTPFPTGSGRAVVMVTTGEPGMRIRSSPNPSATLLGRAFNGSTVAVLDMQIPEEGAPAGSPISWWRIQTSDGIVGFARAIGPAGESNFNLITPPQGGGIRPDVMSGVSTGYGYSPFALNPWSGYPGYWPGYQLAIGRDGRRRRVANRRY